MAGMVGSGGAAGKARGRLLLVPAPLDFGCSGQAPLMQVLPEQTLREAAQLRFWIAENARTTRAYLKRIDGVCPLVVPLQQIQISELPRSVHKQGDHAGAPRAGQRGPGKGAAEPAFRPAQLLGPALQGEDMGLVSEAGMPGVADPGSSIVRAAHQAGLQVVPLVGPVSLLLALAASGLNGQNFAFIGYLPQDDGARQAAISRLQAHILQTGQAQIVIETPYRNARLWQALLQHLKPSMWLSISAGLSLPGGRSVSKPVHVWRQESQACPADNKTPAVFVLGC